MLHAGLDLSRRKIDVCLMSSAGEVVDEWASPPDADGLRGLAARAAMWAPAVRGVIESLNGARFVYDRLEEHGWDDMIADATQVQGSGAAGVQDRQDRRARARPVIWFSISGFRTNRSAANASWPGFDCAWSPIPRR